MFAFTIAVLGAFGIFSKISDKIRVILSSSKPAALTFTFGYHLISTLLYAGIIFLCTLYLVAGTYNPFIYYRF